MTKERSAKKRRRLLVTLLTVPFIIHVFLIYYVPLLGWSLAFTNYRPGLDFTKLSFVGLKYFKLIGYYWEDVLNSLKNTLGLGLLNILFSWAPMVLAILLTELPYKRYKKTLQTVGTLPNFVSWVIVYSLSFAIFSTDGIFNKVMMQLGLSDKSNTLLSNKNTVWGFMIALNLWKSLGWNSIIYLAAIAGIDQSLYEAATVDGANRFQRIWHITLPGMMGTFVVLLLLQVGNILSGGFEQYLAFSNTMTASKLEVLDIYTYRIGIQTQDYSFATAVGMLKSLISVTLLFGVNKLSKAVRGESII